MLVVDDTFINIHDTALKNFQKSKRGISQCVVLDC